MVEQKTLQNDSLCFALGSCQYPAGPLDEIPAYLAWNQLGERLDGILLYNELEQVWADENAGDDVAEHDRLFEALEQHGHDAGGNHHHGQVLQKTHFMHGAIRPENARANPLGQARRQKRAVNFREPRMPPVFSFAASREVLLCPSQRLAVNFSPCRRLHDFFGGCSVREF